MDSELVVRQLTGHYKVRNPGLQPLFATLVRELEAVGPYTVEHVPRRLNQRADQLANEALNAESKQ